MTSASMIGGKGDQAAEQQRDADCSEQQKTSRNAIKAIHEKPSVRTDHTSKPFRDLTTGAIKTGDFLPTSFTKIDRCDPSTVSSTSAAERVAPHPVAHSRVQIRIELTTD
jgi:hypothetical protein